MRQCDRLSAIRFGDIYNETEKYDTYYDNYWGLMLLLLYIVLMLLLLLHKAVKNVTAL